MKPTTKLLINACDKRRSVICRSASPDHRKRLASYQRYVRVKHGTKAIVKWVVAYDVAANVGGY